MNFTIIADDLTGACDTGVQLAKFGLNPVVLIQGENQLEDKSTVILNTDSRGLEPEQAYKKNYEYCKKIDVKEKDSIIYKKIDSTMRGNIGQELNAIYDYFKPEFIFIVPGHPSNGRQIVNGYHMLNKTLLHETEVSRDPKHPIDQSSIVSIIEKHSNKKVGHIDWEVIKGGYEEIIRKLEEFKDNDIQYVSFDSVVEEDLKVISEFIMKQPYSSICAGSAGLLNHLPEVLGMKKSYVKHKMTKSNIPALFVVGSISQKGRNQLKNLLSEKNIAGIELNSIQMLQSEKVKEKEVERVFYKVDQVIKEGKSIVLYSSGDIQESEAYCKKNGKSMSEVSDRISANLGELAVKTINHFGINRLFLTGGETAVQVMVGLGVDKLILLDEIESGVPIGVFDLEKEIYAITKAGNFGSDNVMVRALSTFKEG